MALVKGGHDGDRLFRRELEFATVVVDPDAGRLGTDDAWADIWLDLKAPTRRRPAAAKGNAGKDTEDDADNQTGQKRIDTVEGEEIGNRFHSLKIK
jgi:hypothetical protein